MDGTRSEGRLDSWKEIAGYLRRDVSTVQRWEKREGMPVHRQLHDKLGSVYAFTTELDAWTASRSRRGEFPELDAVPDDRREPPIVSRASSRLRPAVSMAALVLLVGGAAAAWRVRELDYFWRNPLAGARFQPITDFEGSEHSAAISRDGKLVAFVSSRDGQADVWVTQIGSGQLHNVTAGRMPELVNRSVRTMEFSPDAAQVSFWVGKSEAKGIREIGIWVAPTLGGDPRPFFEGAAEINWSPDGQKLVYHTPAAGDPMLIRSDGGADRSIFVAPAPQHSHFPVWSPDQAFIYFVQGNLPDQMDIWRIASTGGSAERVTHHNARVSHPTFIDRSTLLYLATDDDGQGPWIYGLDVGRRVPHRVSYGVEHYTSLAASADGRRLIATASRPRTSLWRARLSTQPPAAADLQRITLPTSHGRLPRSAADYLLYVASNGTADGLWKLKGGTGAELWTAPAARITGAPAISPNNARIAFVVDLSGRTRLMVMNADGTAAASILDSLELRGAPAWSPDGRSIVVAGNERGIPHLFRIDVATASIERLLDDYALDPAWAPDGDYLLYSGADIGTTFPIRAVAASGRPREIAALTLTRGARRMRFVPGRPSLVVLRGDIEHKNLWTIDLETGTAQPLTNFGRDVIIGDFDISPDGREIVVERLSDDSDIVQIDLPPGR